MPFFLGTAAVEAVFYVVFMATAGAVRMCKYLESYLDSVTCHDPAPASPLTPSLFSVTS